MTVDYAKAPFPYFGGKQHAAPLVWAVFGDVPHYVEPFCGSLAVLLRRPHECNRTYFSETVNDIDGLLCNAWRSLQLSPDATAEAASWPVSECDLHARHLWLVNWAAERNFERLMADPDWHDSKEPGVARQLPHLGDDGRGVDRPQLREPGVARQLPHLGDDGRGVNHAGLREPGVHRKRPHLGDDGRGVNRPQLREPGVADEHDYHPMTMPELRRWFAFLSARLRHVRILCGNWTRAVTNGAAKPLTVRQGKGPAGIFLDPPYADTADRDNDLYSQDSLTVAHAVREWCLTHGDDPELRIVLAGFEEEHGSALTDAGWREVEWFKRGHLRGGMGNQNANGHQQARERLWLSPHCLGPEETPQRELFG